MEQKKVTIVTNAIKPKNITFIKKNGESNAIVVSNNLLGYRITDDLIELAIEVL